MIQRSQSLWLLLASICAFLSIEFPFFHIGSVLPNQIDEFTAKNNLLLVVLTSILGTLLLFVIFLYKNRKLQLRLTWLAFAISALVIYLYFQYGYINQTVKPGIALSSVFVFLIPVFCVMAMLGIRRDIKLIRSLDRIR